MSAVRAIGEIVTVSLIACLDTSLCPRLFSCIGHEVVEIVIIPNTVALVFKELFKNASFPK